MVELLADQPRETARDGWRAAGGGSSPPCSPRVRSAKSSTIGAPDRKTTEEPQVISSSNFSHCHRPRSVIESVPVDP